MKLSSPGTSGLWTAPRAGVVRGEMMAVYEFTCKKCGRSFEVTCHMDDREAKAVCPKCGSRKVVQKLTAAFLSPPPAKY
jgi:putative FmdB family regulatory protein